MIEIKKIIEKLGSSKIEYSNECYNILNNDEVIIHFGGKNSAILASRLYEIYRVRYDVEKQKSTRTTFGYNFLLDNLNNCLEHSINIFSIFSNEVTYMIFCIEYDYEIIGVLKSYSSNMYDIERLIPIYRERNLRLNYFRYLQGKLTEKFDS